MDDTAFRIFRLASQGYCCTQILIKMALDEENKENKDLLRAVNGLCGGIGFSKDLRCSFRRHLCSWTLCWQRRCNGAERGKLYEYAP